MQDLPAHDICPLPVRNAPSFTNDDQAIFQVVNQEAGRSAAYTALRAAIGAEGTTFYTVLEGERNDIAGADLGAEKGVEGTGRTAGCRR